MGCCSQCGGENHETKQEGEQEKVEQTTASKEEE